MPKTIAHITDIHLHEPMSRLPELDQLANWQRLMEDLASRQVDEVVFGGDIGAVSAHPLFFKSLESYELQISLRNHDSFEEIIQSITVPPEQDGLYHHFDDEHYRYIIMDSSKEYISDEQLAWLPGALNTTKAVVIFIHNPVLAVPSYIDSRHALAGRDELKGILLDTGLEITLFCGHYHMDDERREANIRQLITPAASYQVGKGAELQLDDSTFGYRLLHISPQKIDSDVIMLKHIKEHGIR